jgi:hypothetical protein
MSNDDEKDLIEFDGFLLTPEQHRHIKSTIYVVSPTLHERRVSTVCVSFIRSMLKLVDTSIKIEAYQPESSSVNLKIKSDSFFELEIVKAAVAYDEVVLAQFKELFCGINNIEDENFVSDLIDNTLEKVGQEWLKTYH